MAAARQSVTTTRLHGTAEHSPGRQATRDRLLSVRPPAPTESTGAMFEFWCRSTIMLLKNETASSKDKYTSKEVQQGMECWCRKQKTKNMMRRNKVRAIDHEPPCRGLPTRSLDSSQHFAAVPYSTHPAPTSVLGPLSRTTVLTDGGSCDRDRSTHAYQTFRLCRTA